MAEAPYAPNYVTPGPPVVYNGTGKTGGDSGKISLLIYT